ncbi:Probable glycosyltransferase At5g03795 [Linum grandiflorum]
MAFAVWIQRSHVGSMIWRLLVIMAMAVIALVLILVQCSSSLSSNNGTPSSHESSSSWVITPVVVSDDSSLGEIQHRNDSSSSVSSVIDVRDKSESTSKNRNPRTVSAPKRVGRKNPTTIAQMNSQLLHSLFSASSMLLSARMQIENVPFLKRDPGLHASSFWNVSTFMRSYELMERTMKVYIYKEGEKPVFHQSRMRGIYASEGWFMKLMKESKRFVVKDPRKAHLFYIPFSSEMLRKELYSPKFHSVKDLEHHLEGYVNLVSQKYIFWNRSNGADHFIAGCHDWAPKLTSNPMGNCIRVLCNANVGKGFRIGKDATLPATSIRSQERPMQDIGGKPHNERHILAFFAGGSHGSLRPVLLQHWANNSEPQTMKIMGPMPRDVESKRVYREYMKSSKYCICARGHEVHTPRVVEAIYYECVPVIISDNYVPPFFEVLNWEEFAVFILEKDVPKLKEILSAIPEEKYVAMQNSVKMVQQHFLWHRKPLRYDLFHMILHSVWHNRVFEAKAQSQKSTTA